VVVIIFLLFVVMLLTLSLIELFKDALNEYAYAAELAGLKYGFKNSVYGIQVSLFSDSSNKNIHAHLHTAQSYTQHFRPLNTWVLG